MLEPWRVIEGDSIDVLRGTPDNTYTAVVTDPPYGLSKPPPVLDVLRQWIEVGEYIRKTKSGKSGSGFLGHTWDDFVPGPALWREVFRTCKPGAIALVFASTRTYHWMVLGMLLAGFECLDTIGWVQAESMPHAGTIDKRIDRRRNDRADVLRCTAWIRARCETLGLTPRDLDVACGTNGMGGHWTSAQSQPYVPTRQQWEKLEPLLGPMPPEMGAQRLIIDAREPGPDWAKREVLGVRKPNQRNGTVLTPETCGFIGEIVDSLPATDTSAEWAGWSTELCGAIEPIAVMRKPCEGTATSNVLKHGCGAMNIGACKSGDDSTRRSNTADMGFGGGLLAAGHGYVTGGEDGRWPKNIMLDEVAADLLDQQVGERKSGSRRAGVRSGMGYSGKAHGDGGPAIEGSRGGPSRYFWVGPQATEDDVLLPIHYFPKVRFSEREVGLPVGLVSRHPTVKPQALMQRLCRLVGHPKGRILDPFAGTGTTLRAARAEGLPADGVEREAEYARLARFRSDLATLNDYRSLSSLRLPTDPLSFFQEWTRDQ